MLNEYEIYNYNPLNSPFYKSIIRSGVPKTRRQRMYAVLGNVFLHLHPARLPRHAVKVGYTWCMGGLSFFLFVVLFMWTRSWEKRTYWLNEKSILSDVSEIQQIEKKVFCKTYNEKYYSINLIENKLTEYQNIEELKKAENFLKLNLIKVTEFYQKRKWEVSGILMIINGILSIIASVLSAILIYRFIVYGKTLGTKNKKTFTNIR